MYNLFYKNGKKIIPEGFVLNYIDSVSLAYWIMGDGSYSNRDEILYLHTEGFSHKENINISKELNIKFNLHSTVHKETKKNNKILYKIYIPNRDINTIKSLVSDMLIPIFKYKLP